MSDLFIMRHAQADSSFGADFGRPLTAEGRQQALRQADWLRDAGVGVHRLFCSPAARTRDTASIVAEHLGFDFRRGTLVNSIYEATAGELIEVLRGSDDQTILLVGHNPGVSALAALLVGSYLSLSPASIAHLQLSKETDQRFDPGSAELLELRHA